MLSTTDYNIEVKISNLSVDLLVSRFWSSLGKLQDVGSDLGWYNSHCFGSRGSPIWRITGNTETASVYVVDYYFLQGASSNHNSLEISFSVRHEGRGCNMSLLIHKILSKLREAVSAPLANSSSLRNSVTTPYILVSNTRYMFISTKVFYQIITWWNSFINTLTICFN